MRQPRQFFPVSLHECFFLFATPTFDLSLTCQGFVSRGKLLDESQLHGEPSRSVTFDLAGLMFREASFEIIRMAGVIGPVSATKNVNPETHTNGCLASSKNLTETATQSSESFDEAQDERRGL